ncbi:putative transcriptional regulator WhiB6 [Mycobacterium marinum]|nr:putative transcriptional regulator WhiB6 [Mycobacterium marinum]BBX55810.1 putative transcriptional regulator WhiB6 [Mycobacterium shottsii]GJN97874.1 putative transcriptional regulator WhiB6 [Mycobacterium marinum]GJO11962.1 putative transcriptional regulator WhiB6 [Mycobacterium marinum]GJO13393.1 putative transcriptional regulator WhiB6 [Mycobacterium marinum]
MRSPASGTVALQRLVLYDPQAEVTNLQRFCFMEERLDMTATALYEIPLGVCTQDPDRWTTTPDEEAKTLCRACPRRWACARDAVESPGAEGLWAGVVIPEAGRARAFALGQLRSLAERNGFPARERITAQSA